MTVRAQHEVDSLLTEIEQRLCQLDQKDHEQARALLTLGVGTRCQRRALRYAIADQDRAVRRGEYYEFVEDPRDVERGRRQLFDASLT